MQFLIRYWRVLAIVIAAGLALGLISRCTHQAEARGYDRARAEMAVQVARANEATAALERRQRDQSAAAAANWETTRNALQTQVDGLLARAPVVRLCKPAAASAAPVSGAGQPAAGTDDSAAAGVAPVQVGPDIGTRVVQLAAECERYREQLSALQSWVQSSLQPVR